MSQELIVIEAAGVTVIVKGNLDTSKHRSASGEVHMRFFREGTQLEVSLFDRQQQALVPFTGQPLQPIFFENGQYEVVILPNDTADYAFDHEYEGFRKAVTKISRSDISTGTLHFRNEVGLSELVILKDGQFYFSFTIEVFPTKLDYQRDYIALLEEINAEVYNLAYSFIKRTHLRASRKQYKDPTLTEFYRLLQEHFAEYMKALAHVERFPHHQLVTTYEEVRGERLRKQDSRGRAYLRKHAQYFVDVQNGLPIGGRTILPTKGLLMKKKQTYDTHENRYVEWTMQRIASRLTSLKNKIEAVYLVRKVEPDEKLIHMLIKMRGEIDAHLRKPLWKGIGELDRSVYSLVLQMGMGYREVYQIYTVLSQSLVLHGDLYKMSVKDIATLYEYWTFLKLGQILAQKSVPISQDVVKIHTNGLTVNLKADQTATRVFQHPLTGEKIILQYQYYVGKKSPTVIQKPDSMLSIAKRGKDYDFQYIFDSN